jgi:hypothetical protein
LGWKYVTPSNPQLLHFELETAWLYASHHFASGGLIDNINHLFYFFSIFSECGFMYSTATYPQCQLQSNFYFMPHK